MTRRAWLAALVCVIFSISAIAAERQWQKGTWRDSKIERPRVLFSAQPRNPNDNVPHTAGAREIRTFVIDTSTHRLELRQDATVDTPRISNVRHVAVLTGARQALVRARDLAGEAAPEEIVLRELHTARSRFDELMGARTSDDVLNRIFERFCIGK